jgi:phosphoglycerol transferase
MQGGHMSFANKKNLFIPTPEVKIISYEQLKDNPIFKANKKPFEWGVDDEVLFAHLYKETLQLAKKDKPFFLSLLTLDTHFPTGYLPPKYNVTLEEYYPKVLELTDKRITQFAHWLQQQPFGKNTTLIIVGDHLTMPNQLHNQLTKFNGQDPICGKRTTYNCFINSAITPSKKTNRIFAAFDLTPTILHAAGANWGSNKFNLGVSLFGKSKTLLEEKGIPWYEEHSLRYQKEYIDMISFH